MREREKERKRERGEYSQTKYCHFKFSIIERRVININITMYLRAFLANIYIQQFMCNNSMQYCVNAFLCIMLFGFSAE